MKFVIENYSDQYHTQPLYFHKELVDQGHEATIYETNSSSVFDVLDRTHPDYYITHARLLKNDHIYYAKNNKIKFLINVQHLTFQDINNLDGILHQNNIDCPFFFLNLNAVPKVKHRNIIRIMDCADINLLDQKSNIKFQIPKAYMVDSSQNVDDKCPHHIISNNLELRETIDICLPEIQLGLFYSNYDEIIFLHSDNYITQSFFDSIMFGAKTYFLSNSADIKDMFNSVFKDIDLSYDKKFTNFEELRELVKEKHSPKNRIKTLLSQLPKE